jgi:serine protease Do
MLREAEQDIRRVDEKVGAAVVGVGSRGPVGSGVVVAPGRVVTNAHNVHDEGVTITFGDGRAETGAVSGVDVDGDVAVVGVDTGEIEPVEWSDATPSIGTPVVALANPGGRGLRVTIGFVSGAERTFRGPRGRRISGAIEHTAPLLPGSSGGPVVDLDGRLLGLNTHRLGEGFYLAIPAVPDLRQRIDALAGGEAPTRLRLGVAVVPGFVARRMRRAVGLPDTAGVLVRSVDEGGPADRAGLSQGDLIVAVGGRPVAGIDELHAALDSAAEGEPLPLRVLRGVDEIELAVDFG